MRVPTAALLLLGLALAGCTSTPTPPGPGLPGAPGEGSTALPLTFIPPVDLHGVGYEPSIAVDATGTIYYTAHKVLDRPETWPYPGSWFLVSRDAGKTWGAPGAPGGLPLPLNVAQQFVGDEGDIGVDARGWVYFVDTYLADNHLHVWSDQGKTWQSSQAVQKTSGLDDRPWVTAQGQGIVHYLGNNGQPVEGGRVWYYRSTDAGVTWTQGVPIAGDGWTTIDAERTGQNVYISTEADGANAPGKIVVYASHDAGVTFGQPVTVGERTGSGRQYPIVSAGDNGTAWLLWMDCGSTENCADTGGAQQSNNVYVARTGDAGATWQTWNITTSGFADYPTIAAGPNNTVAVAFYATPTVPATAASEWFLYAAMARAPAGTTPDFKFEKAAPEVVYKGQDLHALHDFFEIAIGPDEALHLGYMHAADSDNPQVHDYGARTLWYGQGRHG